VNMYNVDFPKKWGSFVLSFLLIFSLAVGVLPQTVLAASANHYEKIITDPSGRQLIQAISPLPPPKITVDVATVLDVQIEGAINTLSNVPAFYWSYGCSATSAAMLFGYYDRAGYSNMYTGQANGGICPLDNSIWGHTAYPSVTCGECPLSATHDSIDGRTINGHVDDYWIDYGQTGPDPYYGHWTEHTLGDCVGDYMGTNQAKYGNIDGGTTFFWYTNGDPLYDYTGSEPAYRDGCHGMKLFAQSRGYTVLTDFSQMIKGQGSDPNKGFTFADFQAEIDAGRPVLIQVTGHTMLGYGYDTSTNTIYVHDTWDYSNHQMTWGGTYAGLQQRAVTVIRLETISPQAVPVLNSPATGSTVPTSTPRLEWNASTGATDYGLQVATTSSFINMIVNETAITSLSYDVSEGTLNWNTTYYWRVNARNSFGSASSWSSYWSFKTAVEPPPNTPSDLIATPISSSQINLTWQDNSGDETGFKIERKTAAGGTYSQLATVGANVTSYSNTLLSANTTYYYRLRAYNAVGNSDYSNEASATTLPPPPSAPMLKSPATASTVPSLTPRLEWNASSGAVSYGAQISTSSSFTSLVVNETGITNLYYDIAPGILKWNTTYYWRVNARNSYGSTSSWSTSRYFKTAIGPPPNAPSDPVATPISSSQINLSWQDNASDETGFKIERKTGSGSYSQIATVGANVTSYSNSRLSASTTYYYRVRAYNTAGNSNYSNEASATTLPPPPSAPTLKSPASRSTVSTLTARLEWNASSGAVSYGVQVSTSSSFASLVVNETGITNLYYDIAPGILKWNTTYYWRVNARNSFGSTSSWSTSRYFRTAAGPPPDAPSNLVATPVSSSRIFLTWQDNSSDETGFKIERKTGSGSYSQIATVGANVTSYSNTLASANTTYYYRVRAYKGTLNSNCCEEASATTLPL
jgi:transcriptional regulator CtsR